MFQQKQLARITLWRFTQKFQQKQLAWITLWRFTQKFQQKQLARITLWRFTQKFQQKQLARMTLWRFTQRFQQKQLAWVRLWRFTQRFPNPRKQILTTIIPPEVSLSFHGFIQYIQIYIYIILKAFQTSSALHCDSRQNCFKQVFTFWTVPSFSS